MAKRKTTRRGGLAPDKYLSDVQLKKLRQYVKDVARQRGSERAIIDELIPDPDRIDSSEVPLESWRQEV